MMTTGHDAWSNSFSHPGGHHVVTDFRFYAQEIPGHYVEIGCMRRVNPQRICMSNLVQPFRVSTAGVDLYRKPKSRDEDRLAFLEIVRVNMTFEVTGNRKFRPTPVAKRGGVKLQPATGSWEAALYFAVNLNAYKTSSIFIPIRLRQGDNVGSRELRSAGKNAPEKIFTSI